jgi:hypothetical protein
MGIFFALKQKALPLRQRGRHKKFKKKVTFFLSFPNRKVNKAIERFFVRSLDKSC